MSQMKPIHIYNPVSLRYILILSFHLSLNHHSYSFSSGFPRNRLCKKRTGCHVAMNVTEKFQGHCIFSTFPRVTELFLNRTSVHVHWSNVLRHLTSSWVTLQSQPYGNHGTSGMCSYAPPYTSCFPICVWLRDYELPSFNLGLCSMQLAGKMILEYSM